MLKNHRRNAVCAFAVVLSSLCVARAAKADDAVGGHAGLVMPLVKFTRTLPGQKAAPYFIGDFVDTDFAAGVTVKLNSAVAIDFETVVGNEVKAVGGGVGGTGLTVDPGIIYNLGPVAVGARIKFDIGAQANVGLIPLINKGIVDLGGVTWFIEGDLPMTLGTTADGNPSIAFALHTGLAF